MAEIAQGGRCCEFCRFFEHVEDDTGLCVRYPPRPFAGTDAKSFSYEQADAKQWGVFPVVHYAVTCGEFAIREMKAARNING